jgi:putative redox protein
VRLERSVSRGGDVGIPLRRVEVGVDGDFPARGSASTPIDVAVRIEGDADDTAIDALLAEVDRVAEIPNSLRGTTPVVIRRV